MEATEKKAVRKPKLQELFDAINQFTKVTRSTIDKRVWATSLQELKAKMKEFNLYDKIDWTEE